MVRTKRITSGGWRTVETFWNAAGTAFFKAPAGAQIKICYGGGWFGFDRQKQTLNGNDYKKLTVGRHRWLMPGCRVKVSQTTDVTYDVYGVARYSPEIKF